MFRTLSRLVSSRSSRSRRPSTPRFRPMLETLEDRTVLSPILLVALNQAVDSGHVANLNTAIRNAGPGGTIQVEPGAVGGTFTLQQTNTPFNANGITIQGDPNAAIGTLPQLNIIFTTTNPGTPGVNFAATGVTLKNLNLGTVEIGPSANGEQVLNSQVGSIFILGGTGNAFNNGNNLISGNTTGAIVVGSGGGFSANDQILNNTITGGGLITSGVSGISVTNDSGVVIKGNIVSVTGVLGIDPTTGALTGAPTAITVTDSGSADIESNTVNVNVDSTAVGGAPPYTTVGISIVWTGALTGVQGAVVQLNNVSTNNVFGGTGLVIDARSAKADANVQVIVQGNDFHNNQIGAAYLAANDGSDFGTTFGGPAQTGGAVSLGGNDFRGTNVAIAVDTASASSGIGGNLKNANAQLAAQNNIFIGFTTATVSVPPNGSTTSTINTSNQLTGNESFIAVLYEKVLDAVVGVSQLDSWLNILTSQAGGQLTVASLFQSSAQGLGHLVDTVSQNLVGHLLGAPLRSSLIAQLQQGTSLESVEAQIIASQDYYTASGGNVLNTAFQQLTGQVANAQISAGLSQQQFATGANGQPNGVQGVALQLLQSQQGRSQAVANFYLQIYGRLPSANELAFDVVSGGSLLNIYVNELGSQKFFTNG